MKLKVTSLDNKETGSIDLADEVSVSRKFAPISSRASSTGS